MAKFIEVDLGPNTVAKNRSVWVNLDQVTHFYTTPEESNRPEMTHIYFTNKEHISVMHDYTSIVHNIKSASLE